MADDKPPARRQSVAARLARRSGSAAAGRVSSMRLEKATHAEPAVPREAAAAAVAAAGSTEAALHKHMVESTEALLSANETISHYREQLEDLSNDLADRERAVSAARAEVSAVRAAAQWRAAAGTSSIEAVRQRLAGAQLQLATTAHEMVMRTQRGAGGAQAGLDAVVAAAVAGKLAQRAGAAEAWAPAPAPTVRFALDELSDDEDEEDGLLAGSVWAYAARVPGAAGALDLAALAAKFGYAGELVSVPPPPGPEAGAAPEHAFLPAGRGEALLGKLAEARLTPAVARQLLLRNDVRFVTVVQLQKLREALPTSSELGAAASAVAAGAAPAAASLSDAERFLFDIQGIKQIGVRVDAAEAQLLFDERIGAVVRDLAAVESAALELLHSPAWERVLAVSLRLFNALNAGDPDYQERRYFRLTEFLRISDVAATDGSGDSLFGFLAQQLHAAGTLAAARRELPSLAKAATVQLDQLEARITTARDSLAPCRQVQRTELEGDDFALRIGQFMDNCAVPTVAELARRVRAAREACTAMQAFFDPGMRRTLSHEFFALVLSALHDMGEAAGLEAAGAGAGSAGGAEESEQHVKPRVLI